MNSSNNCYIENEIKKVDNSPNLKGYQLKNSNFSEAYNAVIIQE